MKSMAVAFVVIISTIFLAACGGGGGAQRLEEEAPAAEGPKPESVTFDIEQGDIYYGKTPDNPEKPPTWTAPTGATMKVNLKNNGALDHNWAIVKQGAEIPEPFIYDDNKDLLIEETGLSPAGKTTSYDITAPLPGEYKIICTVAGHYPSMQGRLVVTE